MPPCTTTTCAYFRSPVKGPGLPGPRRPERTVLRVKTFTMEAVQERWQPIWALAGNPSAKGMKGVTVRRVLTLAVAVLLALTSAASAAQPLTEIGRASCREGEGIGVVSGSAKGGTR